MSAILTQTDYIRWFSDIGLDDIPSVGGKNASLGEMVQTLASQGVRVPNGFAVTADAYRHFLHSGGTDRKIRNILSGLNTRDLDNLHDRRLCRQAAVLRRSAGIRSGDDRRGLLPQRRHCADERL